MTRGTEERRVFGAKENSMCKGPVVKRSIVSQWPEGRTVDTGR